MRTLNGLHREIKGWSWEWERSLQITDKLSGTTILDTLLTDVENNYWYPQLRQVMGPEYLIHIRMYSETSWQDPSFGRHWCDIDPEIWAAECVRRLSDERLRYNGLLPIDDPFVIITFANEQDLQIEGHIGGATWDRPQLAIETYQAIWNWGKAVLLAFKRLAPHAKCRFGTNPLAGGHDVWGYPPDYEYQMSEFKEYSNLCDINLLHAYFNPDGTGTNPENGGYWVGIRAIRPQGYREAIQGLDPVGGIPDPGGLVSQYPKKPWAVTEFGNFKHNDTNMADVTLNGYAEVYNYYSQHNCTLVTPFIWNSADEHAENRIRGNEPLVNGLINLQRFQAPDWPPVAIVTPPPVTGFSYRFAFADLNNKYPNKFGLPLEDYVSDYHGNARQTTQNGVMYSFKKVTEGVESWKTWGYINKTGEILWL